MTRPAPLLIAVVVLALEGVGGLGWAAVLAALIGSFGDVDPITSLTAVASVVFGAAALVGAIGAWGHRTWSWPVGAVLQAMVMLGVIVAGLSGVVHPALLAAVVLGGLGMVALFKPETRRALGV